MNKVIRLKTVELELLKEALHKMPSTRGVCLESSEGAEFYKNDLYLVIGELLFRRGLI